MGCASSAQPMVTTASSEMVKAATNLATDASKKTEDAVQGVRDAMGKTLESAGECVGTVVQNVKHEVKEALHDKVEMIDDAKNSLLSKLHLGVESTTAKDAPNIENQGENSNNDTNIVETEGEPKDDTKNETCIIKNNIVANQSRTHNVGAEDNMSVSSIEIAQAFAKAEPELKNFTNELITEEQHMHNHNNNKDNDTSHTTKTPKVIDTNHMQEKTD